MRSYALTIAGFDPSGGAGLTADIKTFEQLGVQGLAVCTAITEQTEDEFFAIRWESEAAVLTSLRMLMKRYPVKAIKTGILPSLAALASIVDCVSSEFSHIPLVVDPVLRSTTGFDFMGGFDKQQFYSLLRKCALITPNLMEAVSITGIADPQSAAAEMSLYCNVLLKGGHNASDPGTDLLFADGTVSAFRSGEKDVYPKHGSGCILSAAIAASLAKGHSISEACVIAKAYVDRVLSSNQSLLAFHHVS